MSATNEDVTFPDLVRSFTNFLTVAIHTSLYVRGIYPEHSFILARVYNYSVRQNRHPRVCSWITDAVAAVEAELLKGRADRIALVFYDATDTPLERLMFDVSRLPEVPLAEHKTPLERINERGERIAILPSVDLEEQYRATMSRISDCGAHLKSLPDGCTFTIVMELKDRDGVEPPIEHPQKWIPAQPIQVDQRSGPRGSGKEVVGVKTVPIRSIAAGEMVIEAWIEEGTSKFDGSQKSESS